MSKDIYTILSRIQQGNALEPEAKLVTDFKSIFVDPTNGDYRLKSCSPAKRSGVPVGLDREIVGTKIPQGKAPDIGAYQFY